MNICLFLERRRAVKTIRLLCIGFVGLLFSLLLVDDGLSVSRSWHLQETIVTRISTSIWYGLPILIALLFYSVGSLVWFYGQQRTVARLLFLFCSLMTVTFGTLMGAGARNGLLNLIGCSSSAFAVPVLTGLLLRFPLDTFSLVAGRALFRWLLLLYQFLVAVLSLIPLTYGISVYLLGLPVPSWWYTLALGYYGASSLGIIAIVLLSSRHVASVRIQQQVRLFFTSILLSFVPILCLTVLPTLLHFRYVIDEQLSMLFLTCFPLTLGYAILRYQLVVLDTCIRRFVSWLVGVITLAVLSYIFIATSSLILGDQSKLFYIAITMLWPTIAWWVAQHAQGLTEHLFFSEILHYRNIITALPMKTMSTDLTEVAQALAAAARDTFRSPAACVFVLDDQDHSYVLCSPHSEQDTRKQEYTLLEELLSALASTSSHQGKQIDVLHPLMQLLQAASRPLSLHELLWQDKQPSTGLARYLAPELQSQRNRDPLLVALQAQGKMIAMLVLDERGSHERYAGPDFTGIDLLLSHFTPLLQTARLTQALSANNAQLLEANAQLQATNVQLIALDELKYQFLSSTSHEIRTSITVILGYVELLSVSEDELSSEQRKEFLKKTLKACNQLSQQVNVIYEMNRLDFELQHLQTCPILLNTVIAEATDILAAETMRQERQLRVDVPEEVIVLASTRHVGEILLHLLSNAFKYSPEGTSVTITVSVQEDMVTVAIQDQGLGIPPEAHPLLFERFVGLERDLHSPRRGAGLGLATCKQFVESMGGHIWIESSGLPGEGSTVFFTLRRAPHHSTWMDTKHTASQGL